MQCFFRDRRAEFRAQRLICHQIHWPAKQVFQIELNTEIAFGRCWPIEGHEHVDIASSMGLAAYSRAKAGEIDNAELASQVRLMRFQQRYELISF